MDPLTIGALIAGGVSLIGSLVNSNVQANKQRHANLDQYREDREYNSPANQVRRLKDAGLNPAMAMDAGAMTSGNSTSLPHSAEQPTTDFGLGSQAYSNYMSANNERYQTEADVGLKNAQADATRIDNITRLQENWAKIQELLSRKDLNEQQRSVLHGQQKEIETNLQTLGARNQAALENTQADTNLKKAQDRQSKLQADYQELINQFTPEQQKIITSNLQKTGAKIESEVRANDAAAARDTALKALHDAQADGVDISNDVAEAIADVQVQTAEAKRDQEIYSAGNLKKEYEGGTFGKYLPQHAVSNSDLRGVDYNDKTKLGSYNRAARKYRNKKRY